MAACAAKPIEEVDVDEVTRDGQASVLPEDETFSLSGEVDEILTESALTVTDERSEEPLLVLLTPTSMVNGATVTLGALAQLIPPEGSLQFVGTIETFDSVALAERLGIVLNDELFAPWEGDPVLTAMRIDTVAPDASPLPRRSSSPSDARGARQEEHEMEKGVSYIQSGWKVRTSDGHDLGTVVDLSQDSVFLMDDDGQRRRVPKAYIDEEDESAMLAILSIDSEGIETGAFSG